MRVFSGKKTLLLSLFLLILALAVSAGTVTFAWLVARRNAEENGLEISLTTYSNLVIAESAAGIGQVDLDSASAYALSRTVTDGENPFIPCTHDFGNTSPTGLIYLTNTAQVSRSTGLLPAAATAAFAPVTESDRASFFTDYEAYVASAGDAIADVTLTLTLSLVGKGAEDTESYRAASVDIYVDGVYGGTLNAAGKDAARNAADPTAKKTSAEIFTGTVPSAADGSLKLTFRCYFDGALLKSEGQTYVYSDAVSAENVTLALELNAN